MPNVHQSLAYILDDHFFLDPRDCLHLNHDKPFNREESTPLPRDLTLPGSIWISNQLDNRTAIADMPNFWKHLLDVLPVDHILSVDNIYINIFDITCTKNTKRLSAIHLLVLDDCNGGVHVCVCM